MVIEKKGLENEDNLNTTNKFIPLQSENGDFQLDGYLQIKNLVNKCNNNTLLLFHTIENGQKILNKLKSEIKDKDFVIVCASPYGLGYSVGFPC